MRAESYAFISVFLTSLISLVGVFTISLKPKTLRKFSTFFVSLAVGALLGDAFIHLIPETFERLGINLVTSLYFIVGILLFFCLEKFLHWRHCHTPTSKNHQHPFATMNLIGDSLHNFIDGMIIGISYLTNIALGLATTLAIILHEIPQEIGDFGVLIHAGFSRRKAIFFNFLSGLIAILGTIIALFLFSYIKNHIFYLLPIAAGGFLYIACSDLIPEIRTECKPSISFLQFFLIIVGITIISLLTLLE